MKKEIEKYAMSDRLFMDRKIEEIANTVVKQVDDEIYKEVKKIQKIKIHPDLKGSLRVIMKKMCKVVGTDFDTIDFKKPNWFWDYTWTEEQEKKFKEWLLNYLITNKKANKEICGGITNKILLEKSVDWFLFSYSWKTKNE